MHLILIHKNDWQQPLNAKQQQQQQKQQQQQQQQLCSKTGSHLIGSYQPQLPEIVK